MRRRHEMPFGALRLSDGGARFRLWAPGAQRVDLLADGAECPMQARDGGWYETSLAQAATGMRYAFRIDGGLTVPDPASRSNPDDVHAASALTDPLAFDWPDEGWRGRPWHEAVIYEMHLGCFTPEGTFTAAIARLDDLVALGVTAIELMPVADFPGRRGWGYDGVLPFAPEASYGTPDDLKRLVAAAHARGLMVLLDVVYNHFGPDGNYLHAYAPPFFNAQVHTPWGAAINFDGPGSRTVRDFFIHNALYWLEEFHFDGLRIDAVHAMHDGSPLHFIDELAQAVRAGPGRDRHVHLVLENDVNDARRLPRDAEGQPRLATAQWNDDVHHALHVLVSGERDGYYADFAAQPLSLLGRALAEGFAFQGEVSAYRGGEPHGTPSTGLPPLAFVNFLQTHDQVGNRAFGDRLAMLAAAGHREEMLHAVLACVLLAPAPPMLFMGEEYAASTPFLYFCDFSGELATAVTQGRRNEFGRFARFNDPAARNRIPDPNAEATFLRSKLAWDERAQPAHACWLALYRQLLGIRRDKLVPHLPGAASGQYREIGIGLLALRWPLGTSGRLDLLANLSGAAETGPDLPPGEPIYQSHAGAQQTLRPPWSVRVSMERP
ncbi:malto-oligosyltrehalose trehalohydrolase [uncultured Piscinibacter sp.]|uniref:malto-oligosyltrehalose trehalohydrolase n=1 Tax=uncultured Piscinibacter sp. TaxID=1131835 RepID=UPI002633EDF0|nr:malto-oligosyltrehalose trehalohydrolase [uncultured Piscinibacter sp.]